MLFITYETSSVLHGVKLILKRNDNLAVNNIFYPLNQTFTGIVGGWLVVFSLNCGQNISLVSLEWFEVSVISTNCGKYLKNRAFSSRVTFWGLGKRCFSNDDSDDERNTKHGAQNSQYAFVCLMTRRYSVINSITVQLFQEMRKRILFSSTLRHSSSKKRRRKNMARTKVHVVKTSLVFWSFRQILRL